jgi:hypothetical protein
VALLSAGSVYIPSIWCRLGVCEECPGLSGSSGLTFCACYWSLFAVKSEPWIGRGIFIFASFLRGIVYCCSAI